VNDKLCPIPGLDRCNGGGRLTSHMIAVDDTNPTHIYIAFASTSVAGNDDIWLSDSLDSGQTFRRPVKLSGPAAEHRFMPWVCTTRGSAIVSWYDRSRATTARNDLTDYVVASASIQSSILTPGPVIDVSGNSDPQCATGFPCGVDVDDRPAVTCSPRQLIGRCYNSQSPAASSNQACSTSLGTRCPARETCQIELGGCP
jgi:hypothetical protein